LPASFVGKHTDGRLHNPRAARTAQNQSWNAGWQAIVVSATTVIFCGSKHPGSRLQPRNFESAAGRASSRTMVSAGKKAWQGPVVPLAAIVQLIPAGVEVIVPWPLPPGTIATVPVAPGAGAGFACVQPLRNVGVGIPEPSSTSTMQSAGAGYGSFSILKLPFASLARAGRHRP